MCPFEGLGFWVCSPALSRRGRCCLLQRVWTFPRRNQMKLARAKLSSNKRRWLLRGVAPHGNRWWMLKCPLGSRGAENSWRSKSAWEMYHPSCHHLPCHRHVSWPPEYPPKGLKSFQIWKSSLRAQRWPECQAPSERQKSGQSH